MPTARLPDTYEAGGSGGDGGGDGVGMLWLQSEPYQPTKQWHTMPASVLLYNPDQPADEHVIGTQPSWSLPAVETLHDAPLQPTLQTHDQPMLAMYPSLCPPGGRQVGGRSTDTSQVTLPSWFAVHHPLEPPLPVRSKGVIHTHPAELRCKKLEPVQVGGSDAFSDSSCDCTDARVGEDCSERMPHGAKAKANAKANCHDL